MVQIIVTEHATNPMIPCKKFVSYKRTCIHANNLYVYVINLGDTEIVIKQVYNYIHITGSLRA